jgi:polyisoprenoid-binding protein YceI
MKVKFYFLALVAAATLASCGDAKTTTENKDTVVVAPAVEYAIDSVSVVNWKGNMTGVKAYSHYGTVAITEGSVTVQGGVVTAGTFTADLKTITPLDSGYGGKGHTQKDLVGHLSTADFFLVDSFPTAQFVVKKAEGNTITGDLTVRGKTNEEKVTDVVVTADSATVTASGKLVFNRQKYGVAYKAAMKDMLLADDIELTISISGAKK